MNRLQPAEIALTPVKMKERGREHDAARSEELCSAGRRRPGSCSALTSFPGRRLAPRSRFAIVGCVLAAMGILLSAAPAALAAKKYFPIGQFPPAYPANQSWKPEYLSQLFAESVAVSDKNHHIYVADSGRGAIFDYNSPSDKEPARWNGEKTPTGSFGGEHLSVAVDNTTGDVYVANRENHVIDKFTESGELITTFGDSEPSPNGQLAGLKTPAESFSPPTNQYVSFPIAVDQATHDLYVVDPGHNVIDIFNESGAYLSQITATPEGLYSDGGAYTTGVAVNAASGNVYVADYGVPEVFEFNSSDNYVSTWNGGQLPNGPASATPDGAFGTYSDGSPISVATDDSTGNVFVQTYGFSDVDVFDASGNYVPPQVTNSELGEYWVRYAEGIAIDQETHEMYVSSNGSDSVQILKPVVVPNVTINPAAKLTAGRATLSGHVDPATGEGGGPITGCHFDYISNFIYQENTRNNGLADPWAGAVQAPCQTNPPSSLPYSNPTEVEANVTGLSSGTVYHFRLVVSNAEGTEKATGPVFATAGTYGFSKAFGSTGSGDDQLDGPKDVAVDNSNGDIYVADTGNHRIDKFDSSGNFLEAWGWGVENRNAESETCASACQSGIGGTGAGQFQTPTFVEVDNSEGPSRDDVYVADTSDGVVQKFEPSGKLIESWGTDGAIEFGKGGAIGGITVDTHGNLFVVTDNEPYYWTEVGQDGVFRKKTETGSFFGLGTPGGGGIEIDAFGGFFETQEGEGGVNFVNPQAYAYMGHRAYPGGYRELVNSGIALDRATNDLYVDQGSHIDRFSTSGGCESAASGGIIGSSQCGPQDSFGFGDLRSASGLAFDPSTTAVYAANTGDNDVAVFVPVPTPSAITQTPAKTGATTATLAGQVTVPPGGEVTNCHFEYANEATFANELQTVTLAAATGTGNLEEGSAEVTAVNTSTGALEVGAMIEGEGIPDRTEILAIGTGTLELSNPAQETRVGAEFTAKPTGGEFTLSFDGQTTRGIPFNASDEEVAYYLDSLGLIGENGVAVTGPPGGPYRIGFRGSLANTEVPQLTGDSSELKPSGSLIATQTLRQGTGWAEAPTVPCTPNAPITSSTGVTGEVSGLTPFTTYRYRLVVVGSSEMPSEGELKAVTPTQGHAPVIDATSFSGVTPTTVDLEAKLNPELAATIYHFQYGTDTTYGEQTLTSESIGEDSTEHSVETELSGLIPGTTYHFRVIAVNLNGATMGPDETFNTPDAPSIAEPAASNVTQTSATLSAAIRAGFRPTSYSFEYGTGRNYGSTSSGTIEPDNSAHMASSSLSGLRPGTTYHFRVTATNAIGSTSSADQLFTTIEAPAEEPIERHELPKCKKGFVRRHDRCVKKPHRKRHHFKRGPRNG